MGSNQAAVRAGMGPAAEQAAASAMPVAAPGIAAESGVSPTARVDRRPWLPGAGWQPSVAEAGHRACPPPSPRRVLVVDDNIDAAESLAMILEDLGFEVATAYNGQAALQVAAQVHPDAVVTDIGMPGMDGYEVARRLRQQRSLAGALLVAVTGYSQEEHRQRSREAGFDLHLVKPVDIGELCRLLSAGQ